MATITRQSNNRKLLQFVGQDGNRKTIRLGKSTMKQANSFKLKIERLVDAARLNESIDNDTASWLNELDSEMFDRLVNAGLAKHRNQKSLGDFIENYVSNKNIKKSTKTIYGLVKTNLVNYFSADKNMRDITFGDAEKWRAYLKKTGLSDNTANKRTKIAKQFFESALKAKMIAENPFCGLNTSFKPVKEKMHYITNETVYNIFDQCSDAKTRLIIALARFGGMRCISEPLALKWEHIDWNNKIITVPKVKTETRTLPLFPELISFLKAVQKEAHLDDEYIITGKEELSFTHASVCSRFRKMITRAGFKDWPKLFVNLRSSRQTELVSQFPLHVVCHWLGNSPEIAFKHYLQMKDEYFRLAAEGKSGIGPVA